ncbi:DUF4334 domain-containing protein [Brevundimonas sp.]|uniref:DUF4334 domain-containing protein n=1 Tax=Brevundimonas sp. TaxID=1871086 RepID=UPI0028A1CEE6|nr:DUF4334 domain-containing protein [Brevundimonas sp.]
MTAFQHALDQGPITPEKAFALFDALAPVDPDFLIGEWAGEPFATGHPMDGALEATGWRGKRFDSVDAVHPLLFDDGKGGTFAVHPGRFMGKPASGKAVERRAELETDQPAARLRSVLHRGQVTAAMVYDDLPIIDMFRRVDARTVLGVMDMRAMPLPYFFVLRRVS